MMTFLKKIGMAILKGGAIVAGFAPLIQQGVTMGGASQGVLDHLSQLFKIITDVEVMGASLGLSGADKLRAAAPNIQQVVLDFFALKGVQISADQQAKLTAACTALGGNLADILNTVHPDSVTVTDVTKAA